MEKAKKTEVIEKHAVHKGDTGSTEVQVALLTEQINRLTEHMTANRHDHSAQHGLFSLVGHRRRLLTYLSRESVGRYHALISKLGLRK